MLKRLFKESINKYNDILNIKNSYVSGASDNISPFLALFLAEEIKKDAIIIAKNDAEAENIYKIAISLFEDNQVYYLPSLLSSPYQKISKPKSIFTKRMHTLSNVFLNKNKKIIITSCQGFLEKITPKNILENRFFPITKNHTLIVEDLINFLIANNYTPSSMVIEEGQFALRGNIIDIYSSNIGSFRIDLFDDKIEKIRIFDIYTQKTIGEVDFVMIEPSFEIILNNTTIENFKHNYSLLFKSINKPFFDLLDTNILPKGAENYVSLFYENTDTIINYLNNPHIILLNKSKDLFCDINNSYQKEYEYLKHSSSLIKADPQILPPEKIILSVTEVSTILDNYDAIYFDAFKPSLENNNNPNVTNLNVKDIAPEFTKYKASNLDKKNYFKPLIDFIKGSANYTFVILTSSDGFNKNLKSILNDHNLEYATNLKLNKNIYILHEIPAEHGFILSNTVFISEFDISGIKKTFVKSGRSTNKKILEHLSALTIGDIVVHIKHGIGQFEGVTTLKVNNSDHDFIEITYQKEEKLYIPVENIDTISRYSSNQEAITLDKLGSNAFEKNQQKVKERIRDIAYDLIKTAALRHTKKAIIANYDKDAYEDFCKSFPYVETEDQMNAINDVITDLTSGTPTDRLVCGDVGFGKTEVAMRAAYVMASCGHQVALITPTTLLCQQHYNNFIKRFKNFPINIAQISRFVSNQEKNNIKENLASGKIDIVIGTHAILNSSIKIKNLGLIIIDEEQSFGVMHKEKLKETAGDAHILTLSATPIPRTIQLAFKGIKDLSLITTPPNEKLPINTYILPYDLSTINNAILKEQSRGGQVYFVCPKISDILELKNTMEALNITSYVIVHGQMPTKDIEQNMQAFQNKEYDVLISTNIIESGLDLDNVNTIIIQKSELFGLAQLYQLRGRVGRGKAQAFAYLLHANSKPLSKSAEKRLQILQKLDYLGASFALSSYDLDIRGAGNIIGEEQSGHIKEIGFDLYQKLLEKEINNLKYNTKMDEDIESNFIPSINLGIPVLIPKQYISDIETTMELYQRIGKITDVTEIDEIRDEMIDRFGKIPPQVENLLTSINLKIKCKKAHIDKITYGPKGVLFNFYNGHFKEVEKLISYIQSTREVITLRPDGKMFLNTTDLDIKQQITKSLEILRDLASMLHVKG